MYLLKDIYFKSNVTRMLFTGELITIGVLELIIFILCIYNRVKRKGKFKSMDNGSGILLVIGTVGSVLLQPLCVQGFGYLMPNFVFYIGFVCIIIGLFVRLIGVFLLRKEYSFFVIITKEKKFIKKGIFRLVRNPAYLGGFFILLGISMVYRCPLGIFWCVVDLALVYGYRIAMEEKALEQSFDKEYIQYEQETYRLFPYIW